MGRIPEVSEALSATAVAAITGSTGCAAIRAGTSRDLVWVCWPAICPVEER